MASTLSENFGSCANHLSGEERIPELTEFSGSSDEDKACAKLFWQSLTLHPPIESRLVSGDMRQRLPVAGPFVQEKNFAHQVIEDDPKLQAFLATAHTQMIHEESQKLTHLARRREETRFILEKRKAERAEKESISHRTRRPLVPEDEYEMPDEEGEVAMQELDNFDKVMANKSRKNIVV